MNKATPAGATSAKQPGSRNLRGSAVASYSMQTWVGVDGKTWVALYVDGRKFWDGTVEDLARKVIGLPRG